MSHPLDRYHGHDLANGNVIHLACILFILTLHLLFGLTEAGSNFALKALEQIIELIFVFAATPDPIRRAVLRHFPSSITTAIKNFNLQPELVLWTSCPRCSTLYSPFDPLNPTAHRTRCTARDVDDVECGAELLRSSKEGEKVHSRPIRRYPYQSVIDWIARLLNRPGVENYIDGRKTTIGRGRTDVWNSDYLASFLGPNGAVFAEGVGHLVFNLAIDWFNPSGNREAKKKWSVGAIYLVCMNLPLATRYLIENVCLVGIIPGPKEPRLNQVNHFLAPLTNDLKTLWNPGVWISKTRNHPAGRLIRGALGAIVADLPAMKKVAGFTSYAHNYFCHYCMLTSDQLDDFDPTTWTPLLRKLPDHQQAVDSWHAAQSSITQAAITKATGIRPTTFSELLYFNPFRQAAIDQLHLWMGIIKKHLRDAWGMSLTVDAGDDHDDAAPWPPLSANDLQTAEELVLNGTKTAIGELKTRVLEELCYRRGMYWNRKKRGLLRELHKWVSGSKQSSCTASYSMLNLC